MAKKSNSPLITSSLSLKALNDGLLALFRHCKRTAAVAAAAAAAVVAVVAVVVAAAGKCIIRCRVLSLHGLDYFSSFASSAKLWVSSTLSSSRACSAALLAARPFVDGLAPSASVVRCPHRSTKRFSTMSCVDSTRHSLHALNSFPSSLLLFFSFVPPLCLNFSFFSSPLLQTSPVSLVFLAPPEPSLFLSFSFLSLSSRSS